jgi:uncharacterized protein
MTSSLNSKIKSKRCNSGAVIVFAKEPVLGKVKTRLQERFPAETVLALYQSFVLDTLAMVGKISCTDKWVFFESWGKKARFLRRHAPDFSFRPQRGENLGERLAHACKHFRPTHDFPIVIIGTDTPHLSQRAITKTFRLLINHEAVIGPAKDGGFYLLGLRIFKEEIFDGVSWSTNKVLRQMLRNFKKQNLCFHLLPVEFDIDKPTDLVRLVKSHRPLPKNLRLTIRQNPSLKKKFNCRHSFKHGD